VPTRSSTRQHCTVEHVGADEAGEITQRPAPHDAAHRQGCRPEPSPQTGALQIAKRGATLGTEVRLVRDQALRADTTVAAGLVASDVACFQETDKRRAADAEEVRGLLCRHGHALRRDRDAFARGERVRHLLEDAVDLIRDGTGVASRVDECRLGRVPREEDIELAQQLGEVENLLTSVGLGEVGLCLARAAWRVGRGAHDPRRRRAKRQSRTRGRVADLPRGFGAIPSGRALKPARQRRRRCDCRRRIRRPVPSESAARPISRGSVDSR
jgi:hypothetical protein